jgi:microcystin degradation protein MlrC
MKILIARMNHETNTFSPVATPLSAFGQNSSGNGPSFDDDALTDNKGMQTAMAAFIDAAEREGAQIVTPVSAAANPSGPVEAAAYDAICDAILAAAPGCDAVMLDLHGAMVAENSNDGEGDLLERVRAALPNAPIAVALDLHGNVTQKMIDNADVIVSFKTYPHVDMYETGAHAARLMFALVHGDAKPVIAWRQPPLLTHTLRSATAEGAMKRAVDAARAAEADGMLAVSVLSGFSLADIEAPCISVVVVGNGDRRRKRWPSASRGKSGASARISFIAVRRSRSRSRKPRRSQKTPTSPCCCSIMATTACRAVRATQWTCSKKRSGRISKASSAGRYAIRKRWPR